MNPTPWRLAATKSTTTTLEGRDGCQGSADIVSRRHAMYYWYIDTIAPDIPAWMRNRPNDMYGHYRYATVFGNAKELPPWLRRWQKAPSDDEFAAMPFVHNAYLAGLAGIVGLGELAGQPDASAKAELDRLLALRAARFTRDRPAFDRDKEYDGVFNVGGGTAVSLTVSRNFMFMVPEVAGYLRANALDKVKEACRHYNDEVLPYWFVAKAEQGDGENTFSVLFDYHALFQAKAMILKEPVEGLVKFLDVPAFHHGDLYYMDNLCAALEAPGVTKTATKE